MASIEEIKRPSRRRAVMLHLLKLAAGAGIVTYLFHKYDFREILGAITDVNKGWLCIAWCFALLSMWTLVTMQSIIFRPLKAGITPLLLLKIRLQMRFFAMFLPGGAAVIVQWYKLTKPSGRPGITAGLMLFTSLIQSMSAVGVIGACIFADPEFPWPSVRWASLGIVIATGGIPLVLLSPPGVRLLGRLRAHIRPSERVEAMFDKLAAMPRAIAELSKREIAAIVGLSCAGYLFFVFQITYCGRAVGIDIPVVTFVWLGAVVATVANLPVTVAGFGLREAAAAFLLSYYGITEEHSIAYSLVFFAVFPVVKAIIGGITELVDFVQSVRATGHSDELPVHGATEDTKATE